MSKRTCSPRKLWMAAALLAALAGCSDSSPVAPASMAELTSPGPFGFATTEVVLVDGSRATRANGTYAGAPQRTLRTKIWYPAAPAGAAAAGEPSPAASGASAPSAALPTPPAAGGPFPVIGYAHGFLSSRDEAPDLKQHLASHGYVIVAPDFPLSNGGAPGGPTVADIGNQPGDLAFAMEEVARLGGDHAPLAAALDGSSRAIAGLSLGGGTTLIAAYHPTLHLAGIQAAVAFAPASCFFGPDFYARALPTVILSGDADELVPFDPGPQRGFDLAPAPVTLIRLRGGNHLGFAGIDIPGAYNTDEEVGCGAVKNAVGNGGGFETVVEDLTAGTSAAVVDLTACGGVCEQPFEQTMRAARQLELTRAVTLAHFEAVLRGREDASRFLDDVLAAESPEVELRRK